MKLVHEFDALLGTLRPCFHQQRSFERARAMAFGQVTTYGLRTISRIIFSKNEQHKDWSADYKLFSRGEWSVPSMFFQVLKEGASHSHWDENAIVVAMDDTAIKKTGKKIAPVRTLRDPMSPPYHVNLMSAIRFIQASMIIVPDGDLELARAIPVLFNEAAPAKKPRKNAADDIKEQYKKDKKATNLSTMGHEAILTIREQVDQLPNGNQRLLFNAVDGSYCNRNYLRDLPDNIISIARTRKDIKLFHPADKRNPTGRRKIYGDRLPTPEQIRQDDTYPWQTAQIFGAGKYHTVRYKTVAPVLWQKGTGRVPKRLIIIAPLRYRKNKQSRLLYREPAYLLVPYIDIPVERLIQMYFFRWDIEVNHRDEKSLLGIGDAQVRSEKSVVSQPQFAVVVNSLLTLASIRAYGGDRTNDYLRLPNWRRDKKRRPSMLDIIAQLRREIIKEQLNLGLEAPKQNAIKTKRAFKKSRSRIENRKRGFVGNDGQMTTRQKLPIDILAAILYAYC
ncbi:hypothetical protein EH223_02380 [candidate division KSB1 bacterium]|nr:MAG: hypothetical protein EH223_02380 [candidate division KSB1 bacterium]